MCRLSFQVLLNVLAVFQLESEGRRVLGCRKGTVLCDKIFVRCLVSYVQIYNICISFSADKSPIFCVCPLIICLFSIYLWFVFQISCICITKAWQCTSDSSVLNFISWWCFKISTCMCLISMHLSLWSQKLMLETWDSLQYMRFLYTKKNIIYCC